MISQNPVSGKCRLGPLVSPRSVAGRSPQARPALGETRFIKPSRRETWHQDNYGSNTRRSRPENEYEDDRSARSNHSCPGMAGRSGRRHMAGSWGRRVGRRRHQGHSRTDVPRIDRRELRDLGPWRESPEDDRMCPVSRHPLVPGGHRGRRPPAGFRRAPQAEPACGSVGDWGAAARISPSSSKPAGRSRRPARCWPSKVPTSRTTGASPTRGRPAAGTSPGCRWRSSRATSTRPSSAIRVLKDYPVWSITEGGAETDNVGLQFLTIPERAGTVMPAGTRYADYANVHNYYLPSQRERVWRTTRRGRPPSPPRPARWTDSTASTA